MFGNLLTGEPSGLDAGLDEGVAGVVETGREWRKADGLGDAGEAPAVRVAGDEVVGWDLPKLLNCGAEQGGPDLRGIFEVAAAEGFAGLGDKAGGSEWDAISFVVFAGGPGEVGGFRVADGVALWGQA